MPEIIIKTLDEAEELKPELDAIREDFLNSKHFCCCIPAGTDSEKAEEKYFKKCPELKKVCGLAINSESNKVMGFCQMTFEGMPNLLHTTKPGEAYIYMLAVGEGARGMGVGSKLMAWAEEIARERQCSYMALEVIYNNPATRLYERKGYVIQKTALWKKILFAVPLMFFMGPVTCTSNSSPYCNYGQSHYMKKPLE